ncbi:MAG: AMIN-like domain-containing (lipo)protein [Actinomycetaceae bacterium]
MRVRRAAAAAAAAVGLMAVSLTACTDSDDPTTDGGTTRGSTETTEQESTEAPSTETLTEQDPQDEVDSAGSGTDDSAEESVPDESGTTGSAPEDTAEPGGNDAEWMSPDSTDTQVGAAAGGDLNTIRVRTGVHEYYDRVVLDLEGEDTSPGWTASYVTDPLEDGSGAPIDIEGNAFLHLSVTGFRMPVEGEPFHQGVTNFDGGGVDEIYVSAPFEGMIQVVVGVDSARSYRVFTLGDPLRLVIDVEVAG